MAHRLFRQPSDRPASWPAWCASLALHGGVFLAILYLVRHQAVRGAAEVPSREVGIVLKHTTDEGPMYEAETDQQPTEAELLADVTSGEQTFDALPAESEIPSTESVLPSLPVFGTGALDEGNVLNAGTMASGSPTSKRLGGEATVSVFGVEGVGNRFAYVFDRSISMKGRPLKAAKKQLVASLDSLGSVHQFQIIFFNHEPTSWDLTGGQDRIAFATDRNKRLAEIFVDRTTATGGTYRRAALLLALRLRPDVIFFLTDADDPMSNTDVAEAIRRARRDSTAINTIEFGIGPARKHENFLVALAHGTDGQYTYVDTSQISR